MNLTLTSSAFKNGDMIPIRHTCDGEGTSPELSWGQVPEQAKSLALVVDDPDSPSGTYVHWVVYNIPPHTKGLTENIPRQPHLTDGTKQGFNNSGHTGYFGPCPHIGVHRYNFKLYALDTKLELRNEATKNDLEKAMKGHILSETCLMGEYERKQT